MSALKYQVLRVLRAARALGVVDRVRLAYASASAGRRNRAFALAHPGFATPPPHLAFDAFNHVDWAAYREGGLAHARVFAGVLREALPGTGPLDVLEWGCGPGRLVRHLQALLGDRAVRLTGTDSNPESIAWCRAHLEGIRFEENDLEPPLPFPDGSFDAACCFSVFTHLSEAVQLAWARELARVLRPGGVLACTTHGERHRHLLASAAERARFDAGELVVQGNYREGRKWFLAMHPERFVRDRLLAGWEDVRLVAVPPGAGFPQDLWIARKGPVAPANRDTVRSFPAAGVQGSPR